MRIFRTALLTAAGGLRPALVLFSAMAPNFKILGGPGIAITYPGGTNPWTGEVRPMVAVTPLYGEGGQITSTRTDVIPEDYKSYPVIPLPVGFLARGDLLTLTVITIVSRRPGKTQPKSAVSAA